MESETLMNGTEMGNFVTVPNMDFQIDVEFLDVQLTGLDTAHKINLKVHKGIIYALVGLNGAGKGHILDAMVGISKPKSGLIKIFGKPGGRCEPSSIGFMPNVLALYPELTVRENIQYFGQIRGLNAQDLRTRSRFYYDALHLGAQIYSRVENLSFSQQRLVSLIIALIHHPKLLILNEPTLGSDSVTRELIWNLLLKLKTDYGMTIVVGTNQSQGAEMADMIGYAKNGTVAFESSPHQMMIHFEGQIENRLFNFEKAAVKQEASVKSSQPTKTINVRNDHKEFSKSALAKPHNLMIQCSALLWKNALCLKRRPISLAFQLISMILILVGFHLVIHPKPSGIRVSVVNEEAESLWAELYLEQIDPNFVTLVRFNDTRLAYESVANGDTVGVIYIGPDYSEAMIERLELCLTVSMETINKSSIHFTLDNTDQFVSMFGQKVVFEAFFIYVKKLLEAAYLPTAAGNLPVVINPPIYGPKDFDFIQLILPAMLLSLHFFLGIVSTFLIHLEERRLGVLSRTFQSGIPPIMVLTSYLISHFVILAFQVASSLTLAYWLMDFKFECALIWVVVVLVIFLQGVFGQSFGLFVSSIVSNESTALLMTFLGLSGIVLLSGLFWPIEGQASIIKVFSHLLPQTYANQLLKVAQFKGLNSTSVTGALSVPLVWSIVLLTVTSIVYKIRK